ncbi:FAD/FMN-containing dehydrogenase [Pseudonocardia hierapolitana]|uniref:FAD/FMN-containing dehydrogenase n=1 Tax=Pseudonocardia hierapolitana TaxID=1128676 RepID=A0A561T244_9PSEU|nr:FAD-binding oxidoreductase [Pseudonocardia hierapolitana]TWF81165.1 FAD/FMN-containing dehydrogenase [Pseudonocardia hierapolitana]
MATPARTAHESVRLDRPAVEELATGLRGELIGPDDPAYDEHRRVWNGSIDRHPALIARCTGVEDVVAAVGFARTHGLLVAVRGGGHSFPGYSACDAGMVIDLSPMKRIRVDPATRTARVGAGVLLGELDRETQAHGLAVPAGIVTHTGIAGLTLGGGIGWIMRKYGLTIDNLLSVEMVTADGESVTASETRNADLFWGVRGGGGNFGIVTEFEFRLHPVGPQVYAGPVFWAMEHAPEVLRFYRDWVAGCPDELMTIVVQRRAPALPVVPAEVVGRHVIAVVACCTGPLDEAERVLRPLKEFGRPVLDLCAPKPYLVHQSMFDPSFRHGWWYYFRACDVAELGDDLIDTMAEYGSRIVSPITSVALWQMGGAVARADENRTAFNGRTAGFTFNINGNSTTSDGFDAEREWARAYWSALAPHHSGVYVNFLMDEGEERVRQAYGAAKYDRLKALKRRYDPHNLFRLNQNISPE